THGRTFALSKTSRNERVHICRCEQKCSEADFFSFSEQAVDGSPNELQSNICISRMQSQTRLNYAKASKYLRSELESGQQQSLKAESNKNR
ncbi:MAG: hypothetical protein QM237_08650, partial [Bacteroidota bacterium]|nr:hypothetical protein [Bacteroidota bacterium]